jgi:hypothetical protein
MKTISRYCLVRLNSTDVFAGYITGREGREVTMTDTRMLWHWGGATALQVALHGVSSPERCKFTETIAELMLFGVTEIIPCTPEAEASIKGVEAWSP